MIHTQHPLNIVMISLQADLSRIDKIYFKLKYNLQTHPKNIQILLKAQLTIQFAWA